MKRYFLVWLQILVSAAALDSAQPNIIFVMLDDLGYSQLEAYAEGLTVEYLDPALHNHVIERGQYTAEQAFEAVRKASPTLSRLANEGARFENAYASSNLCAPARISVATGVLQNRWGIYRNIDTEAHGLKPHSHLAERLQELGYATAHVGKWHIGSRDYEMVPNYLRAAGVEDPESVKVNDSWNDTYYKNKNHQAVSQQLKAEGFEGSVAPKDHPLNNGFDYYFGYNQWESPFYNATNVWENFKHAGLVKGYNTDVFTDKALRFIGQSLDEAKPFYVQLHYHAVHSPLKPKAPASYRKPFNSGAETLDNFYAHIYAVDQNVQRMLDYLETRDAADNTIIVFTSDNGGSVGNLSCLPGNAPYRGHKGMLLLGGFRVPLFFHWPKGIQQPQQLDQLVSTMDILPTLIAAAGGEEPAEIDGKSLLPQITTGSTESVRDYFAVGGIHARVWGFHGGSSFFTHNESREKAPAGYIVADNRYILRYVGPIVPDLYRDAVEGLPESFEIYDYINDPMEQNNLIHQLPEKADQLKAIWKKEAAAFPQPVEWDISKWKMIIVDDLNDFVEPLALKNPEVSPHEGNIVAYTPNLTRLAENRVLFTNAHSNSHTNTTGITQ